MCSLLSTEHWLAAHGSEHHSSITADEGWLPHHAAHCQPAEAHTPRPNAHTHTAAMLLNSGRQPLLRREVSSSVCKVLLKRFCGQGANQWPHVLLLVLISSPGHQLGYHWHPSIHPMKVAMVPGTPCDLTHQPWCTASPQLLHTSPGPLSLCAPTTHTQQHPTAGPCTHHAGPPAGPPSAHHLAEPGTACGAQLGRMKGSRGLPRAYTMNPISRRAAWSRMLRPSNTKAGLTMPS